MLDRNAIAQRYRSVRAQPAAIAAPLTPEDMLVQSMPDASPTKWHLAHTTWFFEEFVLAPFDPTQRWTDNPWRVLFNSYYVSVGPSHPRAARGVLSRPSLAEVRAWRARVDERMDRLLTTTRPSTLEPALLEAALLGTHHEEQHQELLLTDIKHAIFQNPTQPAYANSREAVPRSAGEGPEPHGPIDAAHRASAAEWVTYPKQTARVGHDDAGFAFDNERPAHDVLVGPFALASRLVTNAEYARFIEAGGYERAEFWLSDGFSKRVDGGWIAPLYWENREGSTQDAAGRRSFTLHGPATLAPAAPVCHLSYYEADAYARWAGARLPTEQEWEVAAHDVPLAGNFVDTRRLSPRPMSTAVPAGGGVAQLFGDVWEWTASAYLPYPRFKPLAGNVGEYNGKFMSGQMVLRGGSCFSPWQHLRKTYRNYFPPPTRWQMAGIRLAQDDV